MTPQDLDALEKLADEATPGPWTTRTLENFGWNVVHYRNRDKFNIERVSKCTHEENAAFIAAANPATIKALIAELREARGLLKDLADELEGEVQARYDGVKDHPAMTPKYCRDLEPVVSARAFLDRNGKGEGG